MVESEGFCNALSAGRCCTLDCRQHILLPPTLLPTIRASFPSFITILNSIHSHRLFVLFRVFSVLCLLHVMFFLQTLS